MTKKNKKPIFIVGAVIAERHVKVGDLVTKLEMKWAEGMIGVMPVFSSQEDAEKYAKDYPIYTAEVNIEKENNDV